MRHRIGTDVGGDPVNTVAEAEATDTEQAAVPGVPAVVAAEDLEVREVELADEVALADDVALTDQVALADDDTPADGDGVPGIRDPVPEGVDGVEIGDIDGVKITAGGEPTDAGARRMDVTETLAVGALGPEIAFTAEPRSAAVAWDAGQAVTEIYVGHYSQLVRLALLLVRDVQTAEEVVQDAFVSMNDAWRRLHDAEKALSYLRQTVVNKSRSVLRHRKVVDMHAPKPAPDEPSAEQAAMAVLESDAVAAALRTLPERQREAIVLRYYADLSEADIAKAMGISRGAVKSHTARAMAALKSILQQETS